MSSVLCFSHYVSLRVSTVPMQWDFGRLLKKVHISDQSNLYENKVNRLGQQNMTVSLPATSLFSGRCQGQYLAKGTVANIPV